MVEANIDRLIVKRILVDNKSSYNVLICEAAIALQVDLEILKRVRNLLVGIGGKLMKVEGSVELLITQGDRDYRRIVRQSFMVTRIEAPYNAIFARSLLNKLCLILFLDI